MSRNLIILSAIAVLLAAYAASDWLMGGVSFTGGETQTSAPDAPAPQSPGQGAAAARLNPLEGLAPERFAAVLEKPLFNPGRAPRPPEPPPPPPQPQPEVQPPPEPPPEAPSPRAEDYALLAVAGGPAGRVAALRLAATGEVVYVREGQPVGEWTVISVGDRSIVIGTPDNNVTLNLFESNGGGADTPPPDAPPPPEEPPPPPEQPPPPPQPPGFPEQAPEPGQ